MNLLEDPSNSDVITFLPDGTSFAILQPSAFASGLMSKHFKILKFDSFVRKLNRWGFSRVADRIGNHCEVYQHPLFRRGKWDLCRKMKCLKGNLSCSSPKSTSRASSPKEVTTRLPKTQDLNQPIGEERKEQMRLLLERGLQDQLAFSAVKNHGPASAFLNHQHHQSKQFQMSFPQDLVDNATNHVLGAAFEVLARDKNHVPNVQLSSHQPALSSISSSDAASLSLQRYRGMGVGNGLMHSNGRNQGREVFLNEQSVTGVDLMRLMLNSDALSQYMLLHQSKIM